MWHDIIPAIVSVVSVGLTYFFGRKSAITDFKTAVLKKRYETAYVPYVKILYYALMLDGIGRNAKFETCEKCFNLLSKNLQYWDSETLRLYPVFYKVFLDMTEREKTSSDTLAITEEFQKAFNEITLSVLTGTQTIAQKLYMPPLGESLIENYRRTCQM